MPRPSVRVQRMRASVRSRREESVTGIVRAGSQPDGSPPDGSRSRPVVPVGVEYAAGWAWRILVIGLASYVLYRVLAYFSDITVPVAIAALLTALAVPFVDLLDRAGLPRVLATLLVVLGGIALVAGILTLVGQQVAAQVDDLRNSVADGIGEIQDWLRTGPLGLTDEQLADWIDRAQRLVQGEDGEVVKRATEVGSRLTHVVAGVFIVLFSTFFFLYDGERIWRFVVQVFPRRARAAIDSSGKVAWSSLTAFVRATVLVALVDALGIALAAYLLGVPLALAIGMLVFLGAFVPIVGAFVSGIVAVLVALVDQGPFTALFMLAAVLVVQQLESHVLQPFLMGRIVAVHPLAIILAIAAGVTVSGIVGALVAVPTVACANAVVRHLANRYGEDPAPSRDTTQSQPAQT